MIWQKRDWKERVRAGERFGREREREIEIEIGEREVLGIVGRQRDIGGEELGEGFAPAGFAHEPKDPLPPYRSFCLCLSVSR